ncbi:vegetative cell wall protein gp1 [Arthroderma uncinatum]|uniref:vegetative cell wall protein gp1 n=1 Tax=Arthroderma uncinatum TaxID=74035 RepID=UPI00144AC880|nr:vegetative cell wall protein gp1 [Arthroderma uncinatum]KAF3482885.1 vegetative cell wall protein gp1 [Arthroderma uncinatum]
MSSRDRSRGHPSASPHQDRRAGGEMRNGSGTMHPSSGSSRAERFEDEKRRIIQSCFSKKDADGSTLESYITHIRITEDAAYPSAPPPVNSPPENKKPRAIIVSVRKSGRVRMHKSRENGDGTFSIGKTWMLDDLSRIQIYDHLTPSNQTEQQQKSWAADLGFIVTITKPYYWTAATSKERDFFIGSLVKIYRKYTGGKVPDLIGLDPSEKEALVGSLPSSSQPPPQPQSQPQSQSQAQSQPPARAQDPRLMHLDNRKPRSRSPSAAPSRDQSPYSTLPPSRDGPPEARKQSSREQFLQNKPSQDPMPRGPPPTGLLPRIPGDNSQPARPGPQTPPVEQLSRKLAEAPSTENLVPSPATSEHPQTLPNRTYKALPSPALSPVSDGGLLPNKTYTPMPAPALSPKSEERPHAYGQNKQPSLDSGELSPFSKPAQTRPSTSESSLPASLPASLRPAFDRSPSYDQKSIKSNDGDDDRYKGPPPSREPPKVEPPPVARNIPQPEPPKARSNAINGDTAPDSREMTGPARAPEPSAPLAKTESSPEQPKPPPIINVPATTASSTSLPETETETQAHRPGLGPMMKSKGGAKDVANVLRKAANAYNAFRPRAGGAAERLLAAKEKEKTEGPDGITGVVPAPLLRGASAEATNKASTEPPKVQVTDSSTGKEVSFGKTTESSSLKRKEMKPVQPPREDNTKKSCSALGIDPAILGGRGVEFDWLLTDLGWDGRLTKDKGIEALETDIRREIGRVQASSWLSQLQSSHDGRVDQLAKLLDRAMDECDELDGLLTLYSHELDTLSEDVNHIESQGQGLQTRLANQRLLQSEIQARVKSHSGSR